VEEEARARRREEKKEEVMDSGKMRLWCIVIPDLESLRHN